VKDLKLKVDEGTCTKCGLCADDCPTRVVIVKPGGYPEVTAGREDQCIACQHCLAVCPSGALSVFGLDPGDSEPWDASKAPSPESMGWLVRNRRSARKYRQENVPAAVINELLDDLQYVPTGGNRRHLRFTVVDDLGAMARLLGRIVTLCEKAVAQGGGSRLAAGVVKYYRRDGHDALFRGAPHLLVVSASREQGTAAQDVSLALAYFELLAASRGLGTCWCGFLSLIEAAVPGVREELGLAPDDTFYSLYFGFPAVRYGRAPQRRGTSQVCRWS
jgi:nitroreductase/NAD-dependent dihydropyrimidine dehydrogenase PreA subunit